VSDRHSPSQGQSGGVSVIIPAYRSAGTIRRAIDSVLAQTYPAAQIIVVDDGSPDDQAAVVEQTYGPRVMLVRQPNGGASSARNAGIDRAAGNYIAFLDADDYWEADRLALQLALFDRHPELGFVAGAILEEIPGEPRGDRPVRSGPPAWYDRVLRLRGSQAFRLATMISTITVLVKRDALGEERFASGLESAEDRDLWVRVLSRHPAYLTAQPVATAVLEEGSISRSNVDRDKANMLRVVERNRGLLGPIWTRLWRSHTLYRWAAVDPTARTALPRLLHSLVLWPLPFAPFVDTQRFGRVRRCAALLMATARGKRERMRAGRTP
jgi:glycosyltransferase involved in cell wall biosynthesis